MPITIPTNNDRPDIADDLNTYAYSIDPDIIQAKQFNDDNPVTISGTTYTTSADKVTLAPSNFANICMLEVNYQALWNANAGSANYSAAIFIGGDQVKILTVGSAGAFAETVNAFNVATTTNRQWLLSGRFFGITSNVPQASGSAARATTGMVIGAIGAGVPDGGACKIFCELARGISYDVEVRHKVSAGSIVVRERKLWVRAFMHNHS